MDSSRGPAYWGMVVLWAAVGLSFSLLNGTALWLATFALLGVAIAEGQRTRGAASGDPSPSAAPGESTRFGDLAERARATDGVAPFNEATLLALADGRPLRVVAEREGALALAVDDAPVELVVDPELRRQGRGRTLVEELLARGETRFWAHGDLPAAQALARSLGLEPARVLLVLRLEIGDEPPEHEHVPTGVELRTFRPDDVDAIVAVNARAFASHPEQGAMDHADFERRAASDWFDPAGLFVAERDGQVVGFHWTKVEDGVGEVYVVGVDPEAHGGGIGAALTARGIRHLHEQGLRVVDLYVEGDNEPALRTYRRLGFVEHARDTLYARAGD